MLCLWVLRLIPEHLLRRVRDALLAVIAEFAISGLACPISLGLAVGVSSLHASRKSLVDLLLMSFKAHLPFVGTTKLGHNPHPASVTVAAARSWPLMFSDMLALRAMRGVPMKLQIRRIDPELLGQRVLITSGNLQALGRVLEDLVARWQDLRVLWRALDARQGASAPSLGSGTRSRDRGYLMPLSVATL